MDVAGEITASESVSELRERDLGSGFGGGEGGWACGGGGKRMLGEREE